MMGRNHIVCNACSLYVLDKLSRKLLDFKQNIQVFNFKFDYNTYHNVFDKLFYVKADFLAVCIMLSMLGTVIPDIIDTFLQRTTRYKGHRELTHAVWTCIVFMYLAVCVLPKPYSYYLFYFTFGFFNHLFYDSFSKMGVCFFYPISNYKKYPNGSKVKKGHVFKFYRTSYAGRYEISEFVFVGIVIFCTFLLSKIL